MTRHCDTTHTHIHDTSRAYVFVYGRSMSIDPVREILLLTNGAAEIDNRPNNPIPRIPPIPIPMKYICAYLRPNSHRLRYIIIIILLNNNNNNNYYYNTVKQSSGFI